MATILVIDDDAAMRRLILRVLKPAGHTLLEAADGAEGVAVLERHDADLVITDMLMPRKEGVATMREIQALNPAVKFLAISAGGELRSAKFLEVAKVMGAHETLAKPFKPQALREAVERLLRQE
jgi:DNA-binding NtrC family response regulator